MLSNVLRFICQVLFRVEVHGLENVPSENQLLIIANHASFLDGLLLGLLIPKKATFVVHTAMLKNRLLSTLLNLTPYVAVDPNNPYAIKQLIKRLKAGENVVIFPEGRITINGEFMTAYAGASFVAAQTGARILPIYLAGAAQSYFGRPSNKHPRRLFPKLHLTVMPSRQMTTQRTEQGKPQTAKLRRQIAAKTLRHMMKTMPLEAKKENTLFNTFLQSIDQFGRKTAIIEDSNQTEETYQDLLKKSLALGRMTCKVSQQNEAVGVLMPNIINTLALILGLIAFNRIPALLNYTAGSSGIKDACIAANIQTVITSKQFIKKAKLTEEISALQHLNILYLEDLGDQLRWRDQLWLVGYALPLPRLATPSVHPDNPAVILFTSGSEGKPKGVVHSHKSILANINQIMAVYELKPAEDKLMMVLPLFHAFGFTGSILSILNGIKILIFPSPLQYKRIPEVIYERACTLLISTSTFLNHYATFAQPEYFCQLRIVIAGAEKLNEAVRKTYAEKFGIPILEAYGATECAPGIAVNTHFVNSSGSVGQLLPSMTYKIESVPGIENGGLLHVKGDNVMLGYHLFEHPGVLVPPRDGWYNTGDIVEVDHAGFIYIKGRIKRFAKVAGEMVSLDTIEQIATVAAPEGQHAATTQEDALRGENIVLYTTTSMLKREDLKAAARSLGYPEIAIARKIIFIDEIPVLGTGKKDYNRLKQMAESQPH